MGEVFLNTYTLAVSYHAFNFHIAEVRFLLPLKKVKLYNKQGRISNFIKQLI